MQTEIDKYQELVVDKFLRSTDVLPIQKRTYLAIAKTNPSVAYLYLWSILDVISLHDDVNKRREMQERAKKSTSYVPRRWFDI